MKSDPLPATPVQAHRGIPSGLALPPRQREQIVDASSPLCVASAPGTLTSLLVTKTQRHFSQEKSRRPNG